MDLAISINLSDDVLITAALVLLGINVAVSFFNRRKR